MTWRRLLSYCKASSPSSKSFAGVISSNPSKPVAKSKLIFLSFGSSTLTHHCSFAFLPVCVCVCVCVCVSCSVMSDSLRPHELKPTRLRRPWDSPGKNTGVGCQFLLQGIFPTQGSIPGFLRCRQILNCLSHQGSCLLASSLLNHEHPRGRGLFILLFPSPSCSAPRGSSRELRPQRGRKGGQHL